MAKDASPETESRVSEFLGLNVTREMKRELRRLAWQQRRPVAFVVRVAIERYLCEPEPAGEAVKAMAKRTK